MKFRKNIRKVIYTEELYFKRKSESYLIRRNNPKRWVRKVTTIGAKEKSVPGKWVSGQKGTISMCMWFKGLIVNIYVI